MNFERKAGKCSKWNKEVHGEMPEFYNSKTHLYPCIKCKTVLLENGGQAVRTTKRGNGFVVMVCKKCSASWRMDSGKFKFKKDVKCESCGGKTTAHTTRGMIQYRKCDDEKCAKNFSVAGKNA